MATRVNIDEQKAKTTRLEEKYAELVKMVQVPVPAQPYRDNLEQPSPLKIVQSVTTYGAYEEPI
ncbi:MAG: hypothetical protein HY683_06125 [Chloroflexi bacterium]|nr:hypothetical protein [Chloroflexota bacterium]